MKHLFLLLVLSIYSVACGWINGTTIDGQWVERSERSNYLHQDDLRLSLDSTPRQKLDYFEESFSDQECENNITKAVFLMLDGNYKESIQKLLIEENLHDKSYEVATNLGTAYELAGENVNALKWIQEGINRNPDSHYGTEWLHVKILETKLKLQDNPAYLKDHHVIDFDEYAYENPRYKEALLYQLRERMLFVKPKDPIVADLLYSYALANANDGGFLEYSMEALELSEKYGYPNSQELTDKQKEFQDIIDHVALMKNLKIAFYIALFFIFLFITYKKKWFFLTRKAQQAHTEKSDNSGKADNVKDNRTKVDNPRPVVDNVIYFIMIFSLLFLLISIFVQISILSYDILEENRGLVFTIAAVLTGVLEFMYLWKFDKFLNQEDVKIKEVRYGLTLTTLGILLFFLVPLLYKFFDYLMLDTGIYIFLTGAFLILGLFLVNSGLSAKRRAKKKDSLESDVLNVNEVKWSWDEGDVNTNEEHMELRYGRLEDGGYDDWMPVAFIAAPKENTFYVNFLIEPTDEQHKLALEAAKRELTFYLIDKGEPDPWSYAKYHTTTMADIYSSIHWSFFNPTKG